MSYEDEDDDEMTPLQKLREGLSSLPPAERGYPVKGPKIPRRVPDHELPSVLKIEEAFRRSNR